ncbi:MAG: endonuclease/exonuclease/phosphatase family protein [Flavobacterium sp.]|uniref:endonuclease/exonuclease/phosphatase family protein n=1 Tax=Flavobacterium sp. TaxID=239 RepID=UPI001B1C564E|nr:endonuclease/exonuclease/phosphatase family protein [Flavobacterium sp.]MBO9583764.1 endonuclease/exonuclease/phosphatase family protein [Flavobacterium sp.]
MKIITWNCNMAFRKKAQFLQAFNPDIVVISECENPQKLQFPEGTKLPSDILWYGANPNKGIGVFSYGDYRFRLLDCHNPDFKNILPIAVTEGKIDFTLFAIWANNPTDKDGAYVTQIWKAINYYEDLIRETKTILIGDFNSNTIWDKPRREGNHTTVVNKLAEKKIFSTYHTYFNQVQGKEEHPTWYLYRHENKPYHLDYCFASNDFIKALEHVEIGSYQDWTMHSDHKPLIIKFNI